MHELRERKYCDAGSISEDLQVKSDVEGRTIYGFASVTGNVDLGGDLIEPGAFAKTVKKNGVSVVHLKNHDANLAFGSTFELEETARGLRFKTRASDTPLGNEMLVLHKDRVMKGMSFAFSLKRKGYTLHDEGNPGSKGQRRTIHEIAKVWEVSSATFPMNTKAGVLGVKDMSANQALALWAAQQELKDGTTLKGSMSAKLLEMGQMLIDIANSGDDNDIKSDQDLVSLGAECDDTLKHMKEMNAFFAGLAGA